MRKILRMGSKAVAAFLWVAKSLLLLIAVGVLVLWSISKGREIGVRALLQTRPSQQVKKLDLVVECDNGWIIIGEAWQHYIGGRELQSAQSQAATQDDGWTWKRISEPSQDDRSHWGSRRGPFRWGFDSASPATAPREVGFLAAQCWVVASVAAAWPLINLARLVRRQRNPRRRKLLGCCQQCGYDLRATATKGGPLLARCPECGADAPAL